VAPCLIELTTIEHARRCWKHSTENLVGKMDQAKGRAKEAVGVLVGDRRLEREGKVERAAGEIKEKARELADEVKRKTEQVVGDKVKSAIKRTDSAIGSHGTDTSRGCGGPWAAARSRAPRATCSTTRGADARPRAKHGRKPTASRAPNASGSLRYARADFRDEPEDPQYERRAHD